MAKKKRVYHNQHDGIFKELLSHLDIATDFLRAYLPKPIVKRIDWKNIQLFKFNPESMIGKLIGQRSADMVYTTKLDGHPGYLICHAEHQSTLNDETYLRAEIYSRLLYMEHQKMHPKSPRPAIVSVVYFHGRENTKNYPTCLDDLKPPKPFDKYFLKPLFINVNDYSDEELEKHGQIAPADIMFKYSVKPRPTKKIFDKIFKSLQIYPAELRENALYYVAEQFDVELEKLFNQARQYFDEGEIMRAKDQLRQEWAEQGREKGREERNAEIAMNAINSGIDLKAVAKITNLPLKVVKELKESKKSK